MNEWAQASALLGAIDYVEGDPLAAAASGGWAAARPSRPVPRHGCAGRTPVLSTTKTAATFVRLVHLNMVSVVVATSCGNHLDDTV
jgi:hypothetical protein